MIKSLRIGLLLVALTMIGCNQVTLESNWSDTPVTIDGDLEEWTGSLQVPPESELAVAARNDGEYLYLALRTHDQEIIHQVVMTGFTLWLDPDGGRKKVVGISYPQQVRGTRSQLQAQQRVPDAVRQLDLLQQQLMTQTDLIFIDENEQVTRLNSRNTDGVQVATTLENWTLQYELRVPLTADWHNRLALVTGPGATVGVGLITTKPERPQKRGSMNGGMPGNGMRGGGRGSGGGQRGGMGHPGRDGAGRPEGGQARMNDPLKLWVKVELAENKITGS